MKNKIWVLTPYFVLFSLIMLGMAAISYYYSMVIFIVELCAAVLSLAIVLFTSLRFKRYIQSIVKSTIKGITGTDEGYLENFKLPIMVVGKNDEVVWYNKYFTKAVANGREVVGENALQYLSNITPEVIAGNEGTDIVCGAKRLTAYGNTTKNSTVIYYIDDTYYKQIAEEHQLAHPNVALVVLDNREDFISDNEEESGQIILQVENTLQRWAQENNSLYKKITGNRYMILFEERVIQQLIDSKFKILDRIRAVKFNERAATVSIGVGRGAENIRESELAARKALDMALGRGGDQVAVVRNGSYQFFGGVERAVEKRSKVKTRVIAETLQKAILDSDKVLIMGHSFSDFDCIGAAIGLYSAISKTFKKHVHIVADTEKTMAKTLMNQYMEEAGRGVFISEDAIINGISSKTLLIIVDTHSPHFLESEKIYQKCSNIVVIDHHRKMVDYIDNAIVFYHEPSASSTCEMCAELVSYIGDSTLSKTEAEALLAGIMLDTKNFVVKTGVRTFESATYLRQKGADTIAVKSLFADNIDTYREKYKLAANAELFRGCAIAVCEQPVANARVVAAQAADDLLAIEGVAGSFVIFPIEGGRINISARSYSKINVQVIMEQLGGGGHQTMAAAQMSGKTVRQAKEELKRTITELMQDTETA